MTIRKHNPNPAIVRSTERMAEHLAAKAQPVPVDPPVETTEIITDPVVIEEALRDTVEPEAEKPKRKAKKEKAE